jgi:hypothetical protein
VKRTLTLKKDTLSELSAADLAGVAGAAAPIPTYATCVHECVVTVTIEYLIGGIDIPSIDVPCS